MRTSYPSLKPAAKDSLSIISVFHHYNWEKDSLLPALERFGRVRHYDRAEPFHHEMNNDLLKTLHCWLSESPADVIFSYLSGENVTPETVEAMRRFGVPMINLALNDKEHFVGKIRAGKSMGSRDICRYFDLCWTSTEDALEKYCVEGATPVYLPEGANPDIHRPFEEEKVYDVSFVGQCYGNRPEIVSRLQSLGINVAPYGSGWPNG
ncbi:MAG TPA: hypothetical protein PK587_13345, partial [Syntrophales bacterium]|nr:hypothetical protein [Syntrophales bacterium]